MNSPLLLQTILGGGFLGAVAVLLKTLSTLRATRSKTSTDAMEAYRQFVGATTDDRDRELRRKDDRIAVLIEVVGLLVNLTQDLIKFARSKGATPAEVDHFQDRLDNARAKW